MTVKVKPLEFKPGRIKGSEVAETSFGDYYVYSWPSQRVFWTMEFDCTVIFEQPDEEVSYTIDQCKEAAQAHWESLIHSCITIEG